MLLSVENLSLSIKEKTGELILLDDVSFDLAENRTLAIVGESGSGKSLLAMSIPRLFPTPKISINKGDIYFNKVSIKDLTPQQIRKIRGKNIGVVFQNPMNCLNPSQRCGRQVAEVLLQHKLCKKSEAFGRVLELFQKVRLPLVEESFYKYPHQLSGGQKQRIVIAMAIACNPKLLIADEPTTALDVTTQKEIIQLIYDLKNEKQMGVIFISHDLALVSDIADDVLIMKGGKVVEKGIAYTIFNNPKHTYTKALLATRPPLNKRLKTLPTIDNVNNFNFSDNTVNKVERQKALTRIYARKPILRLIDLEKTYASKGNILKKTKAFQAVKRLSFDVYRGETVGLVGESGCGKTTLGRLIIQIENITHGKVIYDKTQLNALSNSQMRVFRKDIQMIFQDPYSSLNPRMTIGEAIIEPMRVHNIYSSEKERKCEAMSLLERVGLQASHFYKKPSHFSGGQRQRISIARTIALRPKLIICDEVVSALDVSSQAQVLNLLNQLKEKFGFTYIFISHDLAVVKHMSDRILVMNNGEIIEEGEADELYLNPQTKYTRQLIQSSPILN